MLRDSVRIAETDTLYLARPTFMTRDRDGSFFISDAFWNRVVQAERDGRIRGTLGRAGTGPGETMTLGLAFRINDTMIVVVDNGRRVFNLFSSRTYSFLGTRNHEGIVRSVAQAGDRVWLGAMNLERQTSVMIWDLSHDSLRFLVSLPVQYRQSEPLRSIYRGVSVVVWADTLLVGSQGLSSILVVTDDGAILDTIDIPSRYRRGVPGDVVRALSPSVRRQFPDLFSALSALIGLFRQRDGSFLLVHADASISGRLITERVFVTVLAADRRSVCVDRELSVSQDAAPVITFDSDTLFVLEQTIEGDRSGVTTLKAYTIDTRSCTWLPVKGLSHEAS